MGEVHVSHVQGSSCIASIVHVGGLPRTLLADYVHYASMTSTLHINNTVGLLSTEKKSTIWAPNDNILTKVLNILASMKLIKCNVHFFSVHSISRLKYNFELFITWVKGWGLNQNISTIQLVCH